MASIKVCDRDGEMFVERAPNSIRINDGVIYDELGKATPFSGELCPRCGLQFKQTRISFKGNSILPSPVNYQDKEE